MIVIAKSLVPKEAAIKINSIVAKWSLAIQNCDDQAQYELLSTKLQSEFKNYYEAVNWVTETSSPWVNNFVGEITGNVAAVFYENKTSEGFAGYTIDNLSFTEKNGQLKISGIATFSNSNLY